MTLCIIWEQRSAILAHSSTCLFIILRFQRKDLNLSKVWKKVGIVPIIEIMNYLVQRHFSWEYFCFTFSILCCLCFLLPVRWVVGKKLSICSKGKGVATKALVKRKEFWDYSERVWLRERLECDQEISRKKEITSQEIDDSEKWRNECWTEDLIGSKTKWKQIW